MTAILRRALRAAYEAARRSSGGPTPLLEAAEQADLRLTPSGPEQRRA